MARRWDKDQTPVLADKYIRRVGFLRKSALSIWTDSAA